SAEGFRIQELRTLPKSGWVRHSARRALGAGITNRPLERRLQWLEKRPVSSVVAAWHARRGAGDSLYAVARPIG
ncbi:MAG TPA: hypothetical protein VNC50_01445, partial [Planctomycetia bacterium]|nr:hypothetical protein [Planctomycetia bacterium]